MMNTLFRMTMGLGLMVLAAQQVSAQNPRNCAPRPVVLERLTEEYGESRHSIGLGADNVVVEMFASANTGSWTIIATLPDGMTCLIASGQSFETLAQTRPQPGSDA